MKEYYKIESKSTKRLIFNVFRGHVHGQTDEGHHLPQAGGDRRIPGARAHLRRADAGRERELQVLNF